MRKRKWRRRFLWALAAAAILAVAFRLSLPFLLPWALAKAASPYDLDCRYERLDLSLLGADAELWHLSVAPKSGGEPYVHAEYCRADVATPYLLIGKLVVRRVEADGIDLLLERREDGTIPLLEHLKKGSESAKPKEPPPPTPQKPTRIPQQIDLTVPIELDALRLENFQATVKDRSVTPPVETRFDLDVRVSDVGSKTRPARFSVRASSPPILDRVHIEGQGTSGKLELQSDLTFALDGLHLEPLRGYLEAAGIRPVAKDLSFGAKAHISARPAPLEEAAKPPKNTAPPKVIEATIAFEDLAARADGEEAMALDALRVVVARLGAGEAHLQEVGLQGIRLRARKTPEGRLRATGLELLPALAGSPKGASTGAAPPPPSAPSSPVPSTQAAPAQTPAPVAETEPPLRASLDLLSVRDVRVEFRDDCVTPAADLALLIPEMAARHIVIDPDRPDEPVGLTALVTSPNLFQQVRVEGRALPFARKKLLELKFTGTGVAPAALDPYLHPLGIQSELSGGSFTTGLNASLELAEGSRILADVNVDPFVFSDKEQLFELDALKITGIEIDPSSRTISFASIEGGGPRLAVERDESGTVHVLGLKVQPRPPAAPRAAKSARRGTELSARPANGGTDSQTLPAVAKEPGEPVPAVAKDSAPASSPAQSAAWKLRLGNLSWKNAAARFRDKAVEPGTEIAIEKAAFELKNVVVDLAAEPASSDAATLVASATMPGIAEELTARGTLLPSPAKASLKCELGARGITAAAAAPYLKAAGIEPTLKQGAASLTLGASLSLQPDLTRLSLDLENVVYSDGAEELAGVDAVRVKDVEVRPGGIVVAAVEVEKPRSQASRDRDGVLHCAGLAIPTVRPPEAQENPPAGAPQAPTNGAETQPPAPAPNPNPVASPPVVAREPSAPASTFELRRLWCSNGALRWKDDAAAAPVDTALHGDLELSGFVLGREADPATFRGRIAIDGVLDEATAVGTVTLSPRVQAIAVDAAGRGLKAGPLSAYLPQGTTVRMTDGRFRGKLEAGVAAQEKDGQPAGKSARLVVSGVDFRNGESSAPYFALGGFKFESSRIDPTGGRIDIEEVSSAGLEINTQKSEDGSLELMGIAIAPRAPRESAPASSPEAGADAAASAPNRTAPAPPAPAPPAAPAAPPAPAALPPRHLPVLTLKKLDVGIERLSFKDARSPEGKLLAASVRLTNREPIEALGEDVESNRPVLLDVEGKLEPFVRAFGVALETSPFAKEPELKVDVKSEGIQGTEITEVLPDLRELLDGKELTDGRFQAKLESTLRLRRRSPLSFDLSRGFGVQLLVQGVKFQNGEEGPVLLGVDEVVVDVDRFEPKTGEVKVKEIDVQRPIARIQRTPEGIEALGLLVRIPKAAEKPAGEARAPPAAESVPPVETSAAPAPAVLPASVPAAGAPPATASRSDLWPAAAEPPAEISIDRLTMGGLDFRFEDTSLSPPVHVFLNGLDVDVRGATNRMLVEPRTVRFRASVQSGKVNLPAVDKTGVLSGAISDASAVMSGEKVDTTRKTEERELFEDAGVNGKIGLFPRPKGYLLTRLRGFDLSGVKSYAAQAGVVVDSGLIDNATRITLPGDDSLAVDTTVRLESLDISEPPAGPIFRYAHLPAPLQTVIFVLRDEDERISLSLSPQLSSISHLSTPEIVGQAGEQALSALSQLILNAMKAAPMRAVMGFVPAGEEEPKVEESIVLSFEPGDAHLTAAEAAKLEPLMQRLKDGDSLTITLVHSFGALDIERSTLRGNPSPEECVELGLRLRREKELLLKKRQEVAAQARSAVLSGIYQESPALLKSLRAIDRDITAADSALEVVYNLLRPGAEHGAPRRTRNNALALAKSRVSEIRENLVATGAPEIENALRASRPDYDGKGTEGPGTVTLLITPRRK